MALIEKGTFISRIGTEGEGPGEYKIRSKFHYKPY